MSESSLSARRPRGRATVRAPRGGDKRERILDAAVRVFARKGFYLTRVSEVAKAAGVADGTIYLYFKSKDDLLVSLFEHRIERLLTYMDTELPRVASATYKLQRVIELQLGLLEGERDLAEVVTVILRQSTKLMKEYAAPKFTAYFDAIAKVIAEGQASGELRADISPHLAARAIFGALDAITMTWALGRAEPGGLSRASGQVVELVLRGLSSTKP
jgi:TetR/AcrR family fatty acid metabolism transcriptional regulator